MCWKLIEYLWYTFILLGFTLSYKWGGEIELFFAINKQTCKQKYKLKEFLYYRCWVVKCYSLQCEAIAVGCMKLVASVHKIKWYFIQTKLGDITSIREKEP